MKMENPGKRFERNFRESCKEQGIWVMRIKDTYFTAKGIDPDAYVPQQPADFLLHYGRYIYFAELKSTDKKYITIERNGGHGMIKEHQYKDLEMLVGDFEVCGFVLQFERGTEFQMTYWLPVQGLLEFLEHTDKKSINRLDVVQHGGIPVKQNKIKVNYTYDILDILSTKE